MYTKHKNFVSEKDILELWDAYKDPHGVKNLVDAVFTLEDDYLEGDLRLKDLMCKQATWETADYLRVSDWNL